ncbi:hypothetical protein G7K_3598-t1 [Saitoella complicata NRRL Y-17804]|uniref:Uncharacterized protein n=1 Tax=Saitoella complicata (strain BCRC 22490 / CBS 7301 / JCM 7358 / NBRC 10748 / NRRL Y-17804) TaxID=698492 RepID=A0A0E9NI19_SAICN|nr:hypothetical protein G7K_3598-t1 [Saitoella complicata NRRL Y-17804]
MNLFLLVLLISVPISLLVWLALSSCLGDSLRQAYTAVETDANERTMGSEAYRWVGPHTMGFGGSEAIEMDRIRRPMDEEE